MKLVPVCRRLAGVLAVWTLFLLALPLSTAEAADKPPLSAAETVDKDVPVPPTSFIAPDTGVVGPADKDLVIQLRLSALWQIPAANLAQARAGDPGVVRIARSIAAQEVILDRLDRGAAGRLGLPLPNQPTGEQLGWLAEMRGARSAPGFDQVFINRLRAAGAQIFPIIATVRADTRNGTVRLLAQQANQVVMTQMTLLESSGIVDYDSLPSAPEPTAAHTGPVPIDEQLLARGIREEDLGVHTPVALLVLAVAGIAGSAAAVRVFRSR